MEPLEDVMQIDPARLTCGDVFICKYERHIAWKGPYVLAGASYANGERGIRLLSSAVSGNQEIIDTGLVDDESGDLEFYRIPYNGPDNFDGCSYHIHENRIVVLLYDFQHTSQSFYFAYDFNSEVIVASGKTRETLPDVLHRLGLSGH
ncbi:hypothetical protein RCDURKIN_91 [Rhodobacter phage RcDurkin]|nr:hypothetical protein RCDURKIN_91 [Rhodobacter phage RcDurkin]